MSDLNEGGRVVHNQRYSVLGTAIDALTMNGAIELIRGAVTSNEKISVVFCTVSSVLSAIDDSRVQRAIGDADVVTSDGMPLVWLGRRRATVDLQRVYGPDFMVAFMEATGSGVKHFFYGGGEGVAASMQERLSARLPGLNVVGSHAPPMGVDPTVVADGEVSRLNESGADVIWVGLGHPKQELWMHSYRPYLDAHVLAGVGAAFDFHSGHVKEAPQWMKNAGLQWLHRLASDPRRLWKRYLVGNTRFVYLLARETLRSRAARKGA